jgi:type IV pilus assembly protein PilC
MPQFSYYVKTSEGKTLKGLVEAKTIKQAVDLLHQKSMFVISIKENMKSLMPFQGSSASINFNDLVHFTRQLATMITAGLTLIEALSILEQQLKKPKLIKLVDEIEEEVRGGKSFATTLEKYPKIFPPVYLALVKAGEASGKLDVILARLADNLEKSKEFKSKVKGALVYPVIVVVGMVTVSFIVMTVVVPRLTALYSEFDAELPLPTQILMTISNFMIQSWWLVIASVIVGGLVFMKWKDTDAGKHIIAHITLNLPVFGTLIKESTLVELTRTLSILIDGGIPILTALQISQDATNNVYFKEAFQKAGTLVEKGYPLSEPLIENKLFPPILGQMVSVGEQTGKIGDSLFKLSKYFETEAEAAVRTLTTMIEPLIMVVLGLGVGFLVMAVLLPIYSLTAKF